MKEGYRNENEIKFRSAFTNKTYARKEIFIKFFLAGFWDMRFFWRKKHYPPFPIIFLEFPSEYKCNDFKWVGVTGASLASYEVSRFSVTVD